MSHYKFKGQDLVMVFITALALVALSNQVSRANEVSCDLGPSMGGGSSSEGSLDTLNGLGLGCAVVLLDGGSWTLGPRMDFAEQRWSVVRKSGNATQFNSYQARTLSLGVQTTWAFTDDNWNLGYSLSLGMGQGEQDQNVSTSNSSQNLHLSGMSQRDLRHELSLTRRFNQRLSFLVAVQYDTAQQSWDASKGDWDREDVGAGNTLTLTSGTGPRPNAANSDDANYRAMSLKVGVQMLLNSSL
jgi:hypothetical protein